MLFFGALLEWALEQRTRAATETMIGIVFSAALAVGSMMTSGQDLIEALFGTSGALSTSELIFGLVGAVAVIVFIVTQRDSLIVMLVSPEVVRTAGINAGWLNLLYLEAFALTIALGLRYLGVLLMGALIMGRTKIRVRLLHRQSVSRRQFGKPLSGCADDGHPDNEDARA